MLALSLLAACTGRIGAPSAADPQQTPPGSEPTTRPPPDPTPPAVIPLGPGIERLSNREVLGAIRALFPEVEVDAGVLPPDARQSDFTRNRAQIVDPVLVTAYQTIAGQVATDMTTDHRSHFDPCMSAAAPSSACVDGVIGGLGRAAFRRPLDADEASGLRAVYDVGRAEAGPWVGLQRVIEAVLQSPSFLYQRQIGDATHQLTSSELAEALSFLITGRPPDAALAQAASEGRLQSPAERAQQARRLYALPEARAHLAFTLLEWLKLDRLSELAKDANVYPDFFALRADMGAEAAALIEASLAPGVDSLHFLLSTTESEATPALAGLYQGSARPGILTRAAFLSVYASPTESSPVKRGNALLKKLLCVELPIPTELMINIVPPPPDPSLTTRERYAQHSRDPACARCHQQIDPLGFVFEGFDGIGRARSSENGKPIDTQVTVSAGAIAGDYPGPSELIARLGESAEVDACFARNIFRFALATRSSSLEDALVQAWRAAGAKTDLLEVLVTFVSSEWFARREAS